MILEHFRNYLLNLGFQKETANQYCRVIQKYIEYGFDINNINHTIIQSYLYDQILRNKELSTVNLTKSILKKFYIFLNEEYNVKNDRVFLCFDYYRRSRVPIFIEQPYLSRFELIINNSQYLSIRDKIIIMLIMNYGFKNKHIINLLTCDINLNKRTIRVHGIDLPINSQLFELLQFYLPLQINQEYLFSTKKDEQLKISHISYIFSKIQKIHPISVRITARYLRNTYIQKLISYNVDLFSISYLLGNKSVKIYSSYNIFRNLDESLQIINDFRSQLKSNKKESRIENEYRITAQNYHLISFFNENRTEFSSI